MWNVLLILLAALLLPFEADAQNRTGSGSSILADDCANADVGVTLETICEIRLIGRYDTLLLVLDTATQALDQLCIKIGTTGNTDCDYGPTSASPDNAQGAYTSPQGWLFASGHDGGADCDQLAVADGECKLQFTGLSGVHTIVVTAAAAVDGAVVTGTWRATAR